MASLSFRTNSPADAKALLQTLQPEFSQPLQADAQALNQLGLLGSLLQQNMDSLADPAQRAAQQAQLRQLAGNMPLCSLANSEKALLVQQNGFVSLFWGDQIRSDNLNEQVRRYAALTGLPVLGTALYQGENLTLYALSGTQEAEAYYWFAQDEIQPGDGQELAALLQLPPRAADALDDAFDAETLPDLLEGLQTALGISVVTPPCAETLGAPAVQWPGADVYYL